MSLEKGNCELQKVKYEFCYLFRLFLLSYYYNDIKYTCHFFLLPKYDKQHLDSFSNITANKTHNKEKPQNQTIPTPNHEMTPCQLPA